MSQQDANGTAAAPALALNFAERVSERAHELAVGSEDIAAAAQRAAKSLFDQGVASEHASLPYITSLLESVVPRGVGSQKRKREGETGGTHPLFPATPLNEVVLAGMGNEQIWNQLELRASKLAHVLESVMSQEGEDEEDGDDADTQRRGDGESALEDIDEALEDDAPSDDDEDEHDAGMDDSADEGYPGASDLSDVDPGEVFYEPLQTEEQQQKRKAEKEREEMMDMYSGGDPAVLDALLRGRGVGEGGEEDAWEDGEEDGEGEDEREDGGRSGAAHKSILDTLDDASDRPQPAGRRHPTLDDTFFSIDEFNRATEEDERRSLTSRANLSGGDEDEDENDVDLFAAVDEEDDSDGEEKSAAEITYKDFFDPVHSARKPKERRVPPAAKPRPTETPRSAVVRFSEQVRVRPIKKCKPRENVAGLLTGGGGEDAEEDAWEDEEGESEEGNSEEESDNMGEEDEESNEEDDEEESDEEDEEEESGEEDEEDESGEEDEEDEQAGDDVPMHPTDTAAGADATAGRVAEDLFADDAEEDAPSTMSKHEQRLAQLGEEIARFEEENVQKKDWTLMGEASRGDRPENSLLEEDLDFERTAKTKPTLTREAAEGLEALIKRRILERTFDDVIRQREVDALPFLGSKMLELSDTRSMKSLAELYEDEYQAARGAERGDASLSEADAKLDKERAGVAAATDALFNKLEALSNAHYTPKAPKAAIETLSNTASISMESALPTTMSAGTMLAPEEVYDAPRHAAALAGDKSEMAPAEKRRMHNQLRQAKRKRNDRIRRAETSLELARGAPRKGDEKTEKDKALKSLLGNKGVSVVGKDSKRQGVREAVTGKKGKVAAEPKSGTQWKL
ncbi:U3 snoRNP protein [Malassezia sp. CBS 17886]|nr:U3 snoRNP protein [Malassezia sp. CBS 17886]